MLSPTGITESALYVDNLERSAKFYLGLFNCQILRQDDHFCALRITDDQVLLLFRRGASLQPHWIEGGMIPAHDGSGPLHVCFGIVAADLSAWEQHLNELGLPIESRVRWPSGAMSLYFRDPDGHAVELATPGVWRTSSATAE